MWFICNSWLVNVFDLIGYESFYGVCDCVVKQCEGQRVAVLSFTDARFCIAVSEWGGGIHSGQHVVFSACNTQIISSLNMNSGLRMELNRWLLIRLQRPVTTAMQKNTYIDISEVRLAFHNSFNSGLNWLQPHKGASGRHNHNDEPLNWWCAVKKGNILKMKSDLLRFFFEHHVHRLMEHWETWWFI